MQHENRNNPKMHTVIASVILRHQFKWQFVRFIIFNYYLIEAVLASSFHSMFVTTVTILMPLNYLFFAYMSLDFLLKIVCTKEPQFTRPDDYNQPTKLLKYYLLRNLLIIDMIFLSVFITSYFVVFSIARILRLIILIKLLDVADFNNKIYEKIHTYSVMRKLYTILKISYVILLFSHYFGTWFYLIDQNLIDSLYYGTPAIGNQDYYQMNLLCFTPIEQLDDAGRYLYGLYFMVSLITTIAYGDIIGKNSFEQIFVSVLMVLSTVSLALILQQFMDMVRYDSLGLYDFMQVLFQHSKKYNSLKTFMDDSQVSFAVQNKVRSYLVYSEYEKKYHAHEQVVEKLTQKLQLDLKTQSYSFALTEWIIPCMPELQQQVKQLCNISKLVSFQAQTDIYQEIETVNSISQCCFLYKIGGLVEEYIPLTRSKMKIAVNQRKAFNLGRLFLNFNMQVAYDSDEQEELEFQIQQQNKQAQQKSYLLMQTNERKLKSLKISQFILLDAQEFYEFVNTRKGWFKRIKNLKQNIISQDIPLKFLGDCCTVCSGNSRQDHSIQNCPLIHLSYNQRIQSSLSLTNLIMRQQLRQYANRKFRVDKKIKNLNLMLKKIFDLGKKADQSVRPAMQQKVISIFKTILSNVNQERSSDETYLTADSIYDPNGLSTRYTLL